MVNAQLALFGAPRGARALAPNAAAAGPASRGQSDLPELRAAPSIAVGPTSGRSKAAEPLTFDGVATPIPETAPSWTHDRGPDRAADRPGDFSSVRPGFGSGQAQKPPAGAAPKLVQRLSAALLTGALLMTFGLGWIGGSTSSRLFGPAPAAPALKQKSSVARTETRASTDAGREGAGASTRKVAHAPPAWRPEPDPVPVPNGMRNMPRLLPVPETRPTTIEGWTVREVSGATATLEGPDGVWRAARGDIVPGLGRVDSIVRWGSFWMVSTSRGLVASE
jgi:hypothetical protein